MQDSEQKLRAISIPRFCQFTREPWTGMFEVAGRDIKALVGKAHSIRADQVLDEMPALINEWPTKLIEPKKRARDVALQDSDSEASL